MGAILALLPQLIPLISTLSTAATHGIEWIYSIRGAAKQSGEWTPELEDLFMQTLEARKDDPAYQPDKK